VRFGVGLDIKDLCERNLMEKRVNDVVVHMRDEFLKST